MPPQRTDKVQGKGKGNEKEEDDLTTNRVDDLRNVKWERHFYYHEEEEREVGYILIIL